MYSLSATLLALKAQLQNKPVEIHDIYLGSQIAEDTDTLHFINFYKTTNFFTYLSHAEQAYTPLGVSRSSVKRGSKNELSTVGYEIDNVNKAMGAYAAAHDFRNKRVVTRLIFRDNLTSYLDAKVIFDGYIQAVTFEQTKMQVSCGPKIGSLSFETGWLYEIQCNAKFGDTYCKVSKVLAENTRSSSASSGTTTSFVSAALIEADDYWNYGVVTFNTGDNAGASRKITDFTASSDTVTLDYPLDNAVVAGDTYTIYRGCDKSLAMCGNTYVNTANYHGFHAIPLRKK